MTVYVWLMMSSTNVYNVYKYIAFAHWLDLDVAHLQKEEEKSIWRFATTTKKELGFIIIIQGSAAALHEIHQNNVFKYGILAIANSLFKVLKFWLNWATWILTRFFHQIHSITISLWFFQCTFSINFFFLLFQKISLWKYSKKLRKKICSPSIRSFSGGYRKRMFGGKYLKSYHGVERFDYIF